MNDSSVTGIAIMVVLGVSSAFALGYAMAHRASGVYRRWAEQRRRKLLELDSKRVIDALIRGRRDDERY